MISEVEKTDVEECKESKVLGGRLWVNCSRYLGRKEVQTSRTIGLIAILLRI